MNRAGDVFPVRSKTRWSRRIHSNNHILLMEEIRLTTWDVENPCKYWDKLIGAGFQPINSYVGCFLIYIPEVQYSSLWDVVMKIHGNVYIYLHR